jgi:hypothetical protein
MLMRVKQGPCVVGQAPRGRCLPHCTWDHMSTVTTRSAISRFTNRELRRLPSSSKFPGFWEHGAGDWPLGLPFAQLLFPGYRNPLSCLVREAAGLIAALIQLNPSPPAVQCPVHYVHESALLALNGEITSEPTSSRRLQLPALPHNQRPPRAPRAEPCSLYASPRVPRGLQVR